MMILNNHIPSMDAKNIKTIPYCLVLFFSIIQLQAMDDDRMEIDNGSVLENSTGLLGQSRKGSFKALFRAINICSPISKPQELNPDDISAALHSTVKPNKSPVCEPTIQKLEIDLSELAINPEAMNDN